MRYIIYIFKYDLEKSDEEFLIYSNQSIFIAIPRRGTYAIIFRQGCIINTH